MPIWHLIGEMLLSHLDLYATRIQTTNLANFDAQALLDNVAAFTALTRGMIEKLGTESNLGQRLLKERRSVSRTVETLLERASGTSQPF